MTRKHLVAIAAGPPIGFAIAMLVDVSRAWWLVLTALQVGLLVWILVDRRRRPPGPPTPEQIRSKNVMAIVMVASLVATVLAVYAWEKVTS